MGDPFQSGQSPARFGLDTLRFIAIQPGNEPGVDDVLWSNPSRRSNEDAIRVRCQGRGT